MNNQIKEPEYLTICLCFVLALLGGTAKELSRVEECFEWRRFLSNVFISGFCGILIGLFAPDFEHKNWIMAAAGVSGVAGIAFLNFCWELFKSVLSYLVNQHIDIKDKKKSRKGK
jgi:hypothetical protein